MKALALKLNFSEATLRKAALMITGEIMSDDEINKKFCTKEKSVDVDAYAEEESLGLCIGLVLMMLHEEHEKPKKTKFQQRLEEMMANKHKYK